MQPQDSGGGGSGSGNGQEVAALNKQVIQLRESECQFECGSCPPLPFPEIAGEEVRFVTSLPEHGLLALSNYRVVLQQKGCLYHVPLGLIDTINTVDDTSLVAMCKDVKSYWLQFHSPEQSSVWLERLQDAIQPPGDLEKSFAYKFFTQTKEYFPDMHRIFMSNHATGLPTNETSHEERIDQLFNMEVERQRFDMSGAWRVTFANCDYSLCPSYPRRLIIPSCITEANLQAVAQHRTSKRIPAVVYRHQSNGAVLVRCSQPTVGLWYWRSSQDEDFLMAIAEACAFDVPPRKQSSRVQGQLGGDSQDIPDRARETLPENGLPLPHPLYNGHLHDSDDSDHLGKGEVVMAIGNVSSSSDDSSTFGESIERLSIQAGEGIPKYCPNRTPSNSLDEGSFVEDRVHSSTDHPDTGSSTTTTANQEGEQQTDAGTHTPTSDIQSLYHVPDARPQNVKKVLFVDARSYTNAMANRARGGGFEYPEYYNRSDIQFMRLENIHNVRKMQGALSSMMTNLPDPECWMSAMEGSRWLIYLSHLIKAAAVVSRAIAKEGRPVAVHCSDGWDRTPQITALAQIMLDPFYRTLKGFEVLVEREWFEFGHKFSDRCGSGSGGNGGAGERCPVFLQWLDAVHQLLHQFPKAFQFNQAYLVKLSQHIYSNLFGSFLCNNTQERAKNKLQERTYPVWAIFNQNTDRYINYFYCPTQQVLLPSKHIKDLKLWSAVYRSTAPITTDDLDATSFSAQPSTQNPLPEPSMEDLAPGDLVKTRSCDDLSAQPQQLLVRHSSDSNLRDSTPNLAMLNSALGSGSELRNNDNEDSESIEMSFLDRTPTASLTSQNREVISRNIDDTDLDNECMEQKLCGKECYADGVGEEDTMEKLLPVCRVLESEEGKHSQCECSRAENSALARKCPAHLPMELHGIPEASKKCSEVASEISKGTIEKAVEADENGILNSDENEEGDAVASIPIGFNSCKFGSRMLKSDSDIGEALGGSLGKCGDRNAVKGSTDTLVNEGSVCDDCNDVELASCSLHMHGRCSEELRPLHRSCSATCHIDEDIVEHLMRKKLQQPGYKREQSQEDDRPCCVASTNCSVCMQSSKIIADLQGIVTTTSSGSTRRNSTSTTSAGLVVYKDNVYEPVSQSTMVPCLTTTLTTSLLGRVYSDTNGGSSSAPNGSVNGSGNNSRGASSRSTPGHSRTPSSGGLPHHTAEDESRVVYSRSSSSGSGVAATSTGWGGVDGVEEVKDDVQELVQQLLAKQQAEVMALREHLAVTQRALQQQLQHTTHCSTTLHCSAVLPDTDQTSVTESLSSGGSVYAESGGLSDTSWEAVGGDDGGGAAQALSSGLTAAVPPGVTIMGRAPTLWVPDHTANHCHACHSRFWVGLRKHHCRSCGGVFCSDCSGQSAAVPREHCYQPVRVCRQCYSSLHPHGANGEAGITDRGPLLDSGSGSASSSGCASVNVTPTNTPRSVHCGIGPCKAVAVKCSKVVSDLATHGVGCRGSCSKVN